jgi:general secretion pathway protein G
MLKNHLLKLKHQKGMTLVEIMIVLAIIGAVLGVLMPGVFERFEKSKVSETKIAISQLVSQLNMYSSECGKYPGSLEDLIKSADCANWIPEIKKVPKDGWSRDFIYETEGNNFVVKSYGSDKREGGDGTAKDLTSDELE